jgi:protein-S-isoprenylcysteine O-methyltransferase Ste14
MYQEKVRQLRERSFGELFSDLSDQMSRLVHDEIELARVEMTEKVNEAKMGAIYYAAAGMIGLLALGVLTAFFVLILDLVMATWLASLIVFVVYAAAAAILYFVGRDRFSAVSSPVPQETVQTVKEDVRWAKRQF